MELSWHVKLRTYAKTELFEIELFICIKMHLALNNWQELICHKTQTNKQAEMQRHTKISNFNSIRIRFVYEYNPLLLLLSNTPWPGVVLFTNPSARAGYDTRSIFKRSLTGLNSEFSFS